MERSGRPVLLVVNNSVETMALLREVFEAEGWLVVTGQVDDVKRGRLDLVELVERHRPQVLLWDLAPPYRENWTFLRLARSTEAVRPLHLVVTTTNKRALEELVGPTESLELIGKPVDHEVILEAATRGLPGGAARPDVSH